jgi:delta 1-pyrroline-5-carboxylate dehydrogenase
MTENGRLSVVNPATEESIEEIPTTDRGGLDETAERAMRGFEEWRGFAGLDRAEVFHEISAELRGHADELAGIMTAEGGKPFIENRDEVTWVAACFDYYGEIARDSVGYLPAPIEPQQLAMVVKEPVGTVACIVPWNYPLLLAAWKVAPALAAGNAVILKPSEETPLATRRMMELMEDLPEGLFQAVYGAGDVGDALVRHPGVDMVAFTGSQETGRKVGVTAAERLMRANLELGGKDPFIVCDDVDIDIAAQGAVWAACLNAGQVCTSSERFYVDRKVADDFVEASKEFAESLNIGDPMDEETDIGPMINAKGREKVEDHVGQRFLLPPDRPDRCRAVHEGDERRDLRARAAGRRGGFPRRGHRARELGAVRARGERVHEGLREDAQVREGHPGRDGLDQRPPHGQRRGPLRRLRRQRHRQGTGQGRPRSLPGIQARPHRPQGREEGVVVPVRQGRRAGTEGDVT